MLTLGIVSWPRYSQDKLSYLYIILKVVLDRFLPTYWENDLFHIYENILDFYEYLVFVYC